MDSISNNKSKELFQRALKVSPGGVHSPVRAFKGVGGEPLFFKEAQGAYLTSVDGDKYIDFCQSFGPNILGHRDPDVSHVVEQAIKEAWTFGTCEPYSLELAEWITSNISFVDKVRFVCSGTEAVMSALRVARAATKRNLILKFEGCYHGHVDSMLVKAGSGLAGEAASDSAGVSSNIASETLVCPLDNEAEVDKVFSEHGSNIAAVIFEPLPANFGLLIQRKEFIAHICQKAKQSGALVIFDEVISGFRTALGGMAEVLDIKPDLVTYGKVIGGGFPVGAYAGCGDLMDLVAPSGPVYQAGTLAANPIGARAGLATLKKIKNENVLEKLKENTGIFVNLLREVFSKQNKPLAVAQMGSIFWLHLDVGGPIRSPGQFHKSSSEVYKSLFHKCLGKGIYLAPSAFEVGFVSYAHSNKTLQSAAQIIGESFCEVYER